MKTGTRIALIYGVSLVGAAAVSYWRGKRTVTEVAYDTFLWGGVAGTGINVIAAVVVAEDGTILSFARKNAASGMGALGGHAVRMLTNIDTERLYRELNENGVRVGPVPDDPNIINQDEV